MNGDGIREVSKDEFFKVIGPLNVHPHIVEGSYPYTSIFRTPSGVEYGRITGDGRYLLLMGALLNAGGKRA